MFCKEIRKNYIYPCKPQYYHIKVGFKGVNIVKICFRDGFSLKETRIVEHVYVHSLVSTKGYMQLFKLNNDEQ